MSVYLTNISQILHIVFFYLKLSIVDWNWAIFNYILICLGGADNLANAVSSDNTKWCLLVRKVTIVTSMMVINDDSYCDNVDGDQWWWWSKMTAMVTMMMTGQHAVDLHKVASTTSTLDFHTIICIVYITFTCAVLFYKSLYFQAGIQ